MPTLTYNKNGWRVINLRYVSSEEKRVYISYLMSHREEYIWMECPKENVIKWRKRENDN